MSVFHLNVRHSLRQSRTIFSDHLLYSCTLAQKKTEKHGNIAHFFTKTKTAQITGFVNKRKKMHSCIENEKNEEKCWQSLQKQKNLKRKQ